MSSTLTARLRVTLQQMSGILDALPGSMLEAVQADIAAGGDPSDGRGMSVAQVLRTMAVKQVTAWSYDELAFRLQDSLMLRGFCRIGPGDSFSESMVQKSIECVTPQTWERVKSHLVEHARQQGIEIENSKKRFRTVWK